MAVDTCEDAETLLQVAAGGVLLPRAANDLVLIGHQRDRNSGAETARLPKGKLEPGESRAEAAIREVREETGFAAKILESLPLQRYRYDEKASGQTVQKEVAFFLMRALTSSGQVPDGELSSLTWCSFDEALAQLSFETERNVVRAARQLVDAGKGSV